ncbi:MAG: FtsW/RodA/SpoVE family cell cycle protein [Eubacteriales bacterium]|nr:FtsW/RodA/SpoVE family cell cycle protein [Eubacteriales bacterium]
MQRQQQAESFQPQQQPSGRVKYYYDYSLLASVILLATFGLLMVYSSSQYVAMVNKGDSSYYFNKQAIIFAICLVGSFAVSKLCRKKINYKLFRPLAGFILFLATTLQLLTFVMGLSSHGKSRWLNIAGISFQPAEITKIAIIIYMAAVISRKGNRINSIKQVWKELLFVAIPIFAVLIQNLSSGIIAAGIVFVMLFVACRKWKMFAWIASFGFAALIGLKPIAHAFIVKFNMPRPDHYQLRRVFGWAAPELFPTDAYQTLQGLYAIGSGGIIGKGLGESIQKFGQLPEAHNDMIFPIVVEELGLIGAIAIVLLFLFLIYRLTQIATNANDLFASMLCVGIIAHISIQVFLNIAVVTGVIPNTGVTLPFISYGGSAILCTMAEITIALNISNCIRLE